MNKKETNVKAPSASERPVKKNKRFTLYLSLLIVACIIGFVMALIKFFGTEKTRRNTSLTIEFTYEGAAQNLTPSGEKFSINDILDDDIIAEALYSLNMSEKYTVQSIKDSLDINGQYPGDVINQIKDFDSLYDFSESRLITMNDYYPTIYKLKLYDDFDPTVSDSHMKKIVKAIAETYRNYFINRYRYTFNVESLDNMLKLDNYDFSQRVKALKYRMNQLEKYAGEVYKLSTSFKYNGMSFKDLQLKCKALRNDSLSNVEATVMIDVLSISTVRLKNQYQYEIQLLENEKKYKSASLEDINSLIEIYQTDGILYIPSGNDVVTVDSNSKLTYEKLIDKKKSIQARIVVIDSDLDRYRGYISDMTTATYMTSSKSAAVTEKINEIDGKLEEIENIFKDMLNSYNSTIIDDNSVVLDSVKVNGSQLLSGSFILMFIKCAGPLCMIMLVICLLHAALFEIKRYRKNNSIVSSPVEK
ncbi:MAG: hypothetical protein K6E47_03600 [Lachnospiraceae bacterium]|nr:hypothetical protein [Lachnospiraceae bacterium]